MWAALYPGQGSQHPGMGKFLFDNFKYVRELYEQASDHIKLNFEKLCFEGSESELALTENTQACMLLVSTASYKVLKDSTDIAFDFAAGHSVGEYAALTNSQSIKFTDALTAVRKRGEFMQSAVPVGQGSMAAVMGLTAEQVQQLCALTEKESGHSPLEPANYNAPGQIVVSGSAAAIEWAQAHIRKEHFNPQPTKLRIIPLKVSAPFHCSLMKPAEEKMKILLEDTVFNDAETPIVQNVTARPVIQSEELRTNLIKQISAPVRWTESVEYLQTQNLSHAIEVGCGQVLSGLIKKITGGSLKVYSLNSIEDLKTIESIKEPQ